MAQTNIGWMYVNGQGVAQDHAEAMKWFRLAAAQGDINAKHELSKLEEQAKLRMAADQGDVDAQYALGVMHEKGDGVPQGDKEAENWYQRAAEQGHQTARQRLNIIRAKNSEWARRHIDAYVGLREVLKNHPLEHCRNIGGLAEQGIRWVQEIMAPGLEGFRKGYNLEVPFYATAFKRIEADWDQAVYKHFGDLVTPAKTMSCIQ